MPAASAAATQSQRNKLARALFDQVWLEGKTVIAVKPRTELGPFFRLTYEDFGQKMLKITLQLGFNPSLNNILLGEEVLVI